MNLCRFSASLGSGRTLAGNREAAEAKGQQEAEADCGRGFGDRCGRGRRFQQVVEVSVMVPATVVRVRLLNLEAGNRAGEGAGTGEREGSGDRERVAGCRCEVVR